MEPVKQCKYGSNCYRKNPTHFKEYAHKHCTRNQLKNCLTKSILFTIFISISVSEIRLKGTNSSARYEVPDEHSFSEDIILEQLQIMDTLFPSTTVRSTTIVAEKRSSSNADRIDSPAKRTKVDNEVNSKHIADTKNVTKPSGIAASTSSDKSKPVNKEPLSRIELKESIKQTFEAKKTDNSTQQSNTVAPTSTQPHSSSKITRDIHQYISVVNPRGQMQKKLDQAAPYNFFLTTITASKQTHHEPLSITFQGKPI